MDQLEREEENTERALTWKSTITDIILVEGPPYTAHVCDSAIRKRKTCLVFVTHITSDSILRQRAPL